MAFCTAIEDKVAAAAEASALVGEATETSKERQPTGRFWDPEASDKHLGRHVPELTAATMDGSAAIVVHRRVELVEGSLQSPFITAL